MKQDTADTINDILHGVMQPGGFGQLLNIDKESAGKTGTIQDNEAVWFDGYTPELATAAMIAGANSKGTPITLNGQSVGGRFIDVAHGSTVAGPMWAIAMRGDPGPHPGGQLHPADPPPAQGLRAEAACAAAGPKKHKAGATRARGTDPRRAEPASRSGQLRPDDGGHGAAVGAALRPRGEHAHHLAHGAHALAAHPELVDGRGDEALDLLLGQLLGEVLGDHRRLGLLLGGLLRPGRRRRTPRPPRGASCPRWSARRGRPRR